MSSVYSCQLYRYESIAGLPTSVPELTFQDKKIYDPSCVVCLSFFWRGPVV